MRNVLIIGLLLIGLPLIGGLSAQAQGSGTTRPLAPYQRQTPSRIPAFSIQLADGLVAPKRGVFTDQDVVAGRPVLIAYIDPACSHCIQEALHIRLAMDSARLGDLQVVMIGPKAAGFSELLPMLQLDKHPNLHVGWETDYTLLDWYGVRETPFNAWYNRAGELVKTGVQDFRIDELVAWVKDLSPSRNAGPP